MVSPPLNGLRHRVFPYAWLGDLSFLEIKGYIAGVTNPMFVANEMWWDLVCDVTTGEVRQKLPLSPAKVHDNLAHLSEEKRAAKIEEMEREKVNKKKNKRG